MGAGFGSRHCASLQTCRWCAACPRVKLLHSPSRTKCHTASTSLAPSQHDPPWPCYPTSARSLWHSLSLLGWPRPGCPGCWPEHWGTHTDMPHPSSAQQAFGALACAALTQVQSELSLHWPSPGTLQPGSPGHETSCRKGKCMCACLECILVCKP